MESGGLDNAEAIAWICFIFGGVVLLLGLYVGMSTAQKKAEQAGKQKLDEAKVALEEATTELQTATADNLESSVAAGATVAAREATETAKSALEQVGGIVGSLPEHQRFPGMLVLVGAVLMGVGTIQFGGTSIF